MSNAATLSSVADKLAVARKRYDEGSLSGCDFATVIDDAFTEVLRFAPGTAVADAISRLADATLMNEAGAVVTSDIARELDRDVGCVPTPTAADHRTPFQKWVAGVGPKSSPSYVYVASSWRNKYQPAAVIALRSRGIDAYDFRNPAPGLLGFSWREIDPNWESWTPAQWRDSLRTDIARRGFNSDKGGMDAADCCVLVLPSGRSSHLEAAYMAAQGKPVFTLALEAVEPDLMNLLLGPPDYICVSFDELFDRLGVPR